MSAAGSASHGNQASSSSSNTPANMMLGHANHLFHSSNHIRTPRQGSPTRNAFGMSVGGAPATSSSSSIIIDDDGEAHNPGYLDAFRELHAKYDAQAGIGRRLSSNHAPARPSALGLGLSSNLTAFGRRDGSAYSDSSDDGDDTDSDSFSSSRHHPHSHRRLTDASRESRSTGMLPPSSSGGRTSPLSTPNSATFMSTHRGSSASTTSPSQTLHTPVARYAFNADLEEEKAAAAAANAAATPTMDQRSRRSSWSTSARRLSATLHRGSSPSVLASAAAADDDWGFTGIVDVERERDALARMAYGSGDGTTAHPPATLLDEARRVVTAPNSPNLVAAASLHRGSKASPTHESDLSVASAAASNAEAGKRRTSSSGQTAAARSRSLLNKQSVNDVHEAAAAAGIDAAITPEEDALLSTTPAGRRKSSVSNNSVLGLTMRRKSGATGTRSRPSSSNSVKAPFGVPATQERERKRDYLSSEGERALPLSTIQSGEEMGTSGANNLVATMAAIAVNNAGRTGSGVGCSSSSDSNSSNRASLTQQRLQAELQQQQDEAAFHVGPSLLKQGIDSVRKTGKEVEGMSDRAYEWRRRMEALTLGVRFKAFKAKKKWERTFTPAGRD